MRQELINGHIVPYDLSIFELKELLSRSDMVSFALGCEALSQKAVIESYEILYNYLNHKDPYKRRYALEAICHHVLKDKLSDILVEKLIDCNIYVVKTALCMIYEESINVPKDKVFNVLLQKGLELDAYHFRSLIVVTNEEDFDDCIVLLKKYKSKKSLEFVLIEILFNLATDDNWRILYDLTRNHDKAQIRIIACKLLAKFNYLDELSKFANDVDGHVRNLVKKYSIY